MITTPVNFSTFRVDEVASFAGETAIQFEAIAKKLPDELGPAVAAYVAAEKLLRDCHSVLAGTPEVAEVQACDALRDRAYTAFVSLVRAMCVDSNEEVALAAGQVMDIVARIPNPIKLADNVETAKINQLVENLQPLAAQIERIGATARFRAMDEANRAFIRVQDIRYTAESAKASGNMKAAIAQWKPAYKSVVRRINALIELYGTYSEADYKPLVEAHNQLIEHYRNNIRRRRGKGGMKSEE